MKLGKKFQLLFLFIVIFAIGLTVFYFNFLREDFFQQPVGTGAEPVQDTVFIDENGFSSDSFEFSKHTFFVLRIVNNDSLSHNVLVLAKPINETDFLKKNEVYIEPGSFFEVAFLSVDRAKAEDLGGFSPEPYWDDALYIVSCTTCENNSRLDIKFVD